MELAFGIHQDDPLGPVPHVPQGGGDLEPFPRQAENQPSVVLHYLHDKVIHLQSVTLVVLPQVAIRLCYLSLFYV